MLMDLGGLTASTPAPPANTLSGTSIAPIVVETVTIAPTNATAGWDFKAAGTVTARGDSPNGLYRSGIEWEPSPSADRWIRFTANTGAAANGSSSAMNTWLAIVGAGAATRTIEWVTTVTIKIGSCKVEISSDVAGVTILATGYYGGHAEEII